MYGIHAYVYTLPMMVYFFFDNCKIHHLSNTLTCVQYMYTFPVIPSKLCKLYQTKTQNRKHHVYVIRGIYSYVYNYTCYYMCCYLYLSYKSAFICIWVVKNIKRKVMCKRSIAHYMYYSLHDKNLPNVKRVIRCVVHNILHSYCHVYLYRINCIAYTTRVL